MGAKKYVPHRAFPIRCLPGDEYGIFIHLEDGGIKNTKLLEIPAVTAQ